MIKIIKIITIISGILFSSISFANSQNQNLEKRFIDLTNTMTAEQSEYIEKQLDNVYNQNSKMDFEIILTDTSDNQSINDLSTNLFNHYKLGNNPLNNGLLILIAKNDRTYSIKPGLGINSLFPKNIVDDFGNDCFKPNFRENNYYTGINCAINKTNIILKQNNNFSPVTNNQNTEKIQTSLFLGSLFLLLFAILIFLFIKKQTEKNKKSSFEDNYNNHKLYYAPHRANITNQDNNNNNNNVVEEIIKTALIVDVIDDIINYDSNSSTSSNNIDYNTDTNDSSTSSSDFGTTDSNSGGTGDW